jgi:GT2 family glycosyltransferase
MEEQSGRQRITDLRTLQQRIADAEQSLAAAREQLVALEHHNGAERTTTLRQELVVAKRQLATKEQQLSARADELRQFAQDRAQLLRWIGQLDRGVAHVLQSKQWRLGHALASLYRKIRFRSPLPLPHEHWAEIMEELETWRNAREYNVTRAHPRPQAPTSSRESQGSRETVLAEAVAKAEAVSRTEDWPQVVECWQTVLDDCRNNEGLAARARLHIHMARRLSDPNACKDQIAAYVTAHASHKAHPSADKKIVVYTAIAGGFDALKLPEKPDPRFDHVLFTDTPMPETGVYQVRPLTYLHADPVRSARFVKTHPHMLLAGYDVAVWIDANLIILGELAPFVEEFLTAGKAVGAVPHPLRTSIYEEVEACLQLKADDAHTMREQMAHYRQHGFDCDDLIESNVMMFNLRDERLRPFLDTWWKEIDRFSRRDQLSLNYALTQANLEWHPLLPHPLSARTHPAFALVVHDRGAGLAQKLLGALRFPTVDPYAGPSYADVREQRIAAQRHRRIDIVVCAHNALEDVKACLESIRRARSSGRQRLILIDDGSDEAAARYLEEFATNNADWVEWHRNPQARGYTKAANQGLAASRGELVILLNSDTIVADGWAEKMADAVFSTPGAGIVGPLSNAASYQSIPDHRSTKDQTAINALPAGLTVADMNRYCEQWTAAHVLPRVPLIHGFCFGLTREVMDKIGDFDERHFPKGYGEENDYCCRAVDAGFGLVVATHTYVFHAKSKSYTSGERVELIKAGAEALRQLHGRPRIERAVRSMEHNPLLIKFRQLAFTLMTGTPGLMWQRTLHGLMPRAGIRSVWRTWRGRSLPETRPTKLE